MFLLDVTTVQKQRAASEIAALVITLVQQGVSLVTAASAVVSADGQLPLKRRPLSCGRV